MGEIERYSERGCYGRDIECSLCDRECTHVWCGRYIEDDMLLELYKVREREREGERDG